VASCPTVGRSVARMLLILGVSANDVGVDRQYTADNSDEP